VTALLVTLAVLGAAAAPATPLLDGLRAQFSADAAATKAKLTCTRAWASATSSTPAGQPYVVETCADAQQQVYQRDGAAFAVGIAVGTKLDRARADEVMNAYRTELLAAKCDELRAPGQLGVYACSGAFTVVLLNNWSSVDDTHTVSALFGDSASLGAMLSLQGDCRPAADPIRSRRGHVKEHHDGSRTPRSVSPTSPDSRSFRCCGGGLRPGRVAAHRRRPTPRPGGHRRHRAP